MSRAGSHERGPGWGPSDPAVTAETDASTGQVVSLEHAMHPYPGAAGELLDFGSGPQALFALATQYLGDANSVLAVPQEWLDDLAGSPDPKAHVQLSWHPLGSGDPRGSFLVRRRQASQDVDWSFVLVASLSLPGDIVPADIVLHGGQGLRVAGTLRATNEPGKYVARITDFITTLPEVPPAKTKSLIPFIELPALRTSTLKAFDIGPDVVVADMGVKLVGIPSGLSKEWGIELRLDVLKPEPGSDISYRLIGRTRVGSRAPGDIEPVARIPLTADIAASLFAQDPISKSGASTYAKFRPNKSSAVLNLAVTKKVKLGPLPKGSSQKRVLLTDSVNDYVRVTNSPFVASESALPPDDPKEVSKKSLKKIDARTDTFAAINAYHHGRDLFQRLTKFGLVPEDYFKFASLPLIVRYRSGIEPGPGRDGRVINAQARWSPVVVPDSAVHPGTLVVVTPDDGEIQIADGSAKIVSVGVRVVAGGKVEVWEGAIVVVRSVDELGNPVDTPVGSGLAMAVPAGVLVVKTPGQLEVCFAMADLQSSLREAPIGAPLGVACDIRWAWHEFSHVLLAASTGELEFRFAHSAGDALGAILLDPDSALSSDANFRFVSFPWVAWPGRRHDRKVADGWSWTGPLYHGERFFPNNGLSSKKAYWSEQLLSTSLFRLYRALGGDSADDTGDKDPIARHAASAYSAMLVMRAIQSMGPASAVPLLTVEKFVIALKEADAATGAFGSGALRRVGGVAQKAIRWAFEKQGLYGGVAPAVDVFIDDGRRGEYTPISMSGTSWHATGAIEIEDTLGNPMLGDIPPASGDLNVFVIVENRGSSPSSAIDVRVDVARTSAGAIPDWLQPKWKPVSASTIGAPVPAGGKVRVGPVRWKRPAPGSYALFAATTCAEDPSTVDASSALPCASVSGPTCFLVAGDNNLGLRLVRVN